MSKDDNTQMDSDGQERVLSRRDMLKGGLATAAAAIVPNAVAERAVAQSSTEPRLQLGSDWAIDDEDDGSGNNDLRATHQPSGAEFRYDVSSGAWVPAPKVDMEGGDLTNVGSLDTDAIDITERNSGQITVTANGSVDIITGDRITDDNYYVVAHSTSGNGGQVNIDIVASSSGSFYRLSETAGTDTTVNWAVLELSIN